MVASDTTRRRSGRRGLLPAALIALASIGSALEAGADPRIGTERAPIVAGEPTADYPATVQVTRGGAFCSGTLVAPRTVLTAGHCIDPPLDGQGAVTFGDDTGEAGQRVAIERATVHPEVDLALLTLVDPAPALPMPLFTGDVDDHLGEPVALVGFGVTGDLASDPGSKRRGWSRIDHATDVKLYTGYDEQGAWVCHGDSGGSVVLEVGDLGQLAGVVSTGAPECGTPPNGHVRVDAQADWIAAGVLEDSPDLCAADGVCTLACPRREEADPDCAAPEAAGCGVASPAAYPAGPAPLVWLAALVLAPLALWRRVAARGATPSPPAPPRVRAGGRARARCG
jgi:hypothetical protein